MFMGVVLDMVILVETTSILINIIGDLIIHVFGRGLVRVIGMEGDRVV